MSTFYEGATKHYYRSSECYHNSIVKAPALFLCSLDDPVGAVSGIRKVADNWESLGMKVLLSSSMQRTLHNFVKIMRQIS